MTDQKKKGATLEIRYFSEKYRDIQKEIQKEESLLVVLPATKTRICKDYKSIYTNAPSREIKKWFETRRITPLA